jgi:hypothetical protein
MGFSWTSGPFSLKNFIKNHLFESFFFAKKNKIFFTYVKSYCYVGKKVIANFREVLKRPKIGQNPKIQLSSYLRSQATMDACKLATY